MPDDAGQKGKGRIALRLGKPESFKLQHIAQENTTLSQGEKYATFPPDVCNDR